MKTVELLVRVNVSVPNGTEVDGLNLDVVNTCYLKVCEKDGQPVEAEVKEYETLHAEELS